MEHVKINSIKYELFCIVIPLYANKVNCAILLVKTKEKG